MEKKEIEREVEKGLIPRQKKRGTDTAEPPGQRSAR